MADRYHDYYVRSQIITNMYVDVRAITKMMPLNSSIVIYQRIFHKIVSQSIVPFSLQLSSASSQQSYYVLSLIIF